MKHQTSQPIRGWNKLSARNVGMLVCLLAGLTAVANAAEPVPWSDLEQTYQQRVLPILTAHCTTCHASAAPEGELDLERFTDFAAVRATPQAWVHVQRMVTQGEMPPDDSEPLSASDKDALLSWTGDFLHTEAWSRDGDPGPTVLRRLNHAEYTYTVQDLTGVPLQPAREFPQESAAGEGFINAASALSMSPALVTKYLDAGKAIAEHVVLLPDGFRFSPSTTRRDWTNEVLEQIREIYVRHTTGGADVNVLNRWDIQDPKKITEADGRVDLTPYLAVMIRHRDALREQPAAAARLAKEAGINGRYLQHLVDSLLVTRPASPLLAACHDQLQSADVEDATTIAAEIELWQEMLWKYNTVGHFGSIRPWQEPNNVLPAEMTLKHPLDDAQPGGPGGDAGPDVWVILHASDAGDGNADDHVLWRRPRLEMPGSPPVLVRDVAALAEVIAAHQVDAWQRTHEYLEAIVQLQSNEHTVEQVLRERQLSAPVLQGWARFVGFPVNGSREIAGHLDKPLRNVQGHATVNGWGTDATPNLLVNAADQDIAFLTLSVPARGVTVHPSPTQAVRIVWRSPITGRISVAGQVADRDGQCGNGFAWECGVQGQGQQRELAAGVVGNGQRQALPKELTCHVQAGDQVWLAVYPRDENHACDTTQVELALTELDGEQRAWDLAQDIVDTVLDGNPHADGYGNPGVWHFCAVGDESAAAGPEIPAGSALARWRAALVAAMAQETMSADVLDQLAKLAKQVEQTLRVDTATLAEPDRACVGLLQDWRGPLQWLASAQREMATASDLGSGEVLDVRAPRTTVLRIPAALRRGAEFVVDVELSASGEGTGSVQVAVETAPVGSSEQPPAGEASSKLWPGVPILTRADSPARQRVADAYEAFRQLFPAAMCYARIVPVDEVVTLVLFHREDEHLSRLMLDDAQRRRLDRLWDELHFVSQDALTIVSAYEQLMEFATQDADPKVFEPLRVPIRERAEVFRQQMVASEPRQFDALVAWCAKAYRRPLSDREQGRLRDLYGSLRSQDIPHAEALRLVLARVLSSPAFLYRLETPGPGTEPQRVSDWQLASRLSYFLWSSLPDDQLLQEAAAGRLGEDDALERQLQRMVRDPRAARLAVEFGCQWLHLRDFDEHDEKSERHFPEFVDMRAAMYQETLEFFADFFQNDGSVLDLVEADYTFLNESLANYYGVPGVAGDHWRRVQGVREFGRGGLLTQAANLARQSGASRTSPILRGNWISETLLGERLPRPPKNVPVLPEDVPEGLTERQLIEKHSSDAACAKCHRRIDPYGFAMENYDAIGRFRQQDGQGNPIDTQTVLMDGTAIRDADALRDYLANKRRATFVRQFNRKLLGFALGRSVELSDEPLLARMEAALQADHYRVHAAMRTIVLSPQFRQIRGSQSTASNQ